MMAPPKTRITRIKRACDGCQIRKVKCDGGQPCQSCANSEIACTFLRTVHTRGPRRLRETTRDIIERTQRDEQRQSSVEDGSISVESESTDDPAKVLPAFQGKWKRIPVGTLAPQLYIYHVRMFPVWPIVNVDNLIAELQHGDQDSDDILEAYALATSVIAATIAQLRLERKEGEDTCILRASDMVEECEKVCNLIRYRSRINLNTIRISFFLHIYYENQQPGCGESVLHLRESISVAQLMSLHQERSYGGRTTEEQNFRRWILWLLFVTERGVCLLHKMPVIIKTNIALPSISWHDEPSVLPAFIQLINLFWAFEQSGLFDMIRDRDNTDFSSIVGATAILDNQTIQTLHRKLHEAVKDLVSISDVQKVDIFVTRHWMKMILWKLRPTPASVDNDLSVAFPLHAASDFLNTVAKLPASAIEAHGLTMQLKIVEIASSVIDSISHLTSLSIGLPTWTHDFSPSRILMRLHLLLSSFRHKDAKNLVDLLDKKTAEMYIRSGYCPSPSREPVFCNDSIQNRTSLEYGDETTDERQNSLFLPLCGDDISMESILVFDSANELPYGYSNQQHYDTTIVEIGSPRETPPAMFDHHVDQGITAQLITTLPPFTPNNYESNSETPPQALF